MSSEYVYCFADHIDMKAVEDSLSLAALAAASDHGTVAVSLDVAYGLNLTARTVTIDTDSEIGAALNRVFYGFLERGIGRKAFTVQRLRGGLDSARSAA